MAMPVPAVDGQIGLWTKENGRKQLLKTEQFMFRDGPLSFAHSDWAGYSVFEEAFTLGHAAGQVGDKRS